jgi:hypothetical protein
MEEIFREMGKEEDSLSSGELLEAIDHLYASLELMVAIERDVFDGVLDWEASSRWLADAWFQVNCCRLYTERFVDMEERLQPAMGLINDAKSMIDSMVAWGYGLTRAARGNVVGSLDQAGDLVHSVLEELESWIGFYERESDDSLDSPAAPQ